MAYTLAQIAHIETDFSEKFGIPRQSGLVEELRARIVFEPEFRSPDAVRGLDGYDYIWLVWQFSTVVQAGHQLAPHRAPAAAGRQYPHGGVCHPQPVPAQCAGAFQRKAAESGTQHPAGTGTDRWRGRPFGWYADF